MGKGYNNYMCKKPFHPGSKANIKRAWMAEQKTENEKKKQEELKVQYEKEQDLYNNRALLSTESKDKLELNFMYQAPPGAKRERQKEDDEPEFKFEWQRKYNAPREDYAKGNADIKDQPFGIPVRNVRCIKCHKWGHINTDKECPLFSQASTSSMPTTSMDPMELMKQMKEDGYGLKENVLGHHLNPAAPNQQLIPSDESDPEMEFLKSLSEIEKKKLLRKLKKLSKKQEKASHCKKKKSKKSGKSKSKDKSSDHKRKKRKKSHESEASDESGTESSSEESAEGKQKKKKHSSRKKSKQRDFSESSDSELNELNKLKYMKKTSQGEKDMSEKKLIKAYVSSYEKVQNVSSDTESESKKSGYKISKDSGSKNAVKEIIKNSSESDREFKKDKRKSINHLKEEKSKESIRPADISSESDQGRNVKMSFEYSTNRKSSSHSKDSRSKVVDDGSSKKIRTFLKQRSSSESQDEKSSHKYSENKMKHRSDNFEKQHCSRASKPQLSKSNDNNKHDNKCDRKNEKKNKEHDDWNRSDLCNLQEMDFKRKKDKEYTESKQKRKTDDSLMYEEKIKNKNDKECIKSESKKNANNDSNELSKTIKGEDEPSKLKRKVIDIDFIEQEKFHDKETSISHFKKKKVISDSDKEKNSCRTADEQKQKDFDSIKKTREIKMGEKFDFPNKRNIENKLTESEKKQDSDSKNLNVKQKCNSPLHPDGFSHLHPQTRVEANYVQTNKEYQGNEHDDFRHLNREKRSPSVKQKYNS